MGGSCEHDTAIIGGSWARCIELKRILQVPITRRATGAETQSENATMREKPSRSQICNVARKRSISSTFVKRKTDFHDKSIFFTTEQKSLSQPHRSIQSPQVLLTQDYRWFTAQLPRIESERDTMFLILTKNKISSTGYLVIQPLHC